jgi:hypothetical protein
VAARTGMVNLINELRGLTYAGTADFSVNGVSYHSDDHLQDTLDRYARQYSDHGLEADPDNIGGTLVYKRYFLPPYRFEEHTSGTSVWRLTNSSGSAFGTAAFSVNYALGEVTMTSDTQGSALYLTARAYSLNRAASDVWSWKANSYADQFDVATDNHKLTRSQKIKHAEGRARFYANEAVAERIRAGEGVTRVRRVDIY